MDHGADDPVDVLGVVLPVCEFPGDQVSVENNKVGLLPTQYIVHQPEGLVVLSFASWLIGI